MDDNKKRILHRSVKYVDGLTSSRNVKILTKHKYIVQEYNERDDKWVTCTYINSNFENASAIFYTHEEAEAFYRGEFGHIQEEIYNI